MIDIDFVSPKLTAQLAYSMLASVDAESTTHAVSVRVGVRLALHNSISKPFPLDHLAFICRIAYSKRVPRLKCDTFMYAPKAHQALPSHTILKRIVSTVISIKDLKCLIQA